MPSICIQGSLHSYDLTDPRDASRPVLVFVHGWLLSRCYWRPLIQRLASRYQCLSYDLRGFGESHAQDETDVSSAYTPLAYAEDLAIFLAELGIENAWLVGHSLGGAIALRTADICPNGVVGVTCLNSGGGIYIEEEFCRFRSLGRYMVQLRHPWLGRLPLLDWLFWKAGTERSLSGHWRRQRLQDFVAADSQAALGALLESTTEQEVHHLPQVVARLQQPVYFMGGDKDPIMQPCYVRHLASFHALFMACAGENLVEIPNCGHMAMLEQTEWVALKLQEIVASHALASA